MFLAEVVEVTGTSIGWPEAVVACAVCLAIIAIAWAAAWSMNK